MIIDITKNQNECYGCLGNSIVLCTLIVCLTVIVYRLLLILRDLIEDMSIGLPVSVKVIKWYMCIFTALIIFVLFAQAAILYLIAKILNV